MLSIFVVLPNNKGKMFHFIFYNWRRKVYTDYIMSFIGYYLIKVSTFGRKLNNSMLSVHNNLL